MPIVLSRELVPPASLVGVQPAASKSPPRPAGPPAHPIQVEQPPLVVQSQLLPHGCDEALANADSQGIAATYIFNTRDLSVPDSVAISFVGTRVGGTGQPGDRFGCVERVQDLDARTGQVALTARAGHLNPGQWEIVAGPVGEAAMEGLPRKTVVTSTQFAAVAQGVGVRLIAWPVLVGLGAVVALIVQALLVARAGLPVASVVGLSLFGCLLGYPGGKAWFLAVNRRHPLQFLEAGACIQGFLLVAVGVVSLGAGLLKMSPGTVLDATAPGIFIGMAIGRPGCFLTGCCVGRPTSSRWGLWSSDRRLGIRRIPVQLYEAGAALFIGMTSLLVLTEAPSPFRGAIFVGSIAAYTFCRQILFGLRSQSHTRAGRRVTQALSLMAFALVLAMYLLD